MVGRGTYGTVYKAEVRLHGKTCRLIDRMRLFLLSLYLSSIGQVALKELNFISPTPSQFQAFRNEVFALKFVSTVLVQRHLNVNDLLSL
jgi:hypothetical protein